MCLAATADVAPQSKATVGKRRSFIWERSEGERLPFQIFVSLPTSGQMLYSGIKLERMPSAGP